MLARHDFRQPLLLAYLQRRRQAVLGTFAPFGMRSTGIHLGYLTVRDTEKNRIELFTNLPEEALDGLP